MKEFKIFSFAAALLFGTAMLIAAFLILFSYSPNDKSNGNEPGKTSMVNESAVK
jgi:hypothetical protein